MGEAQACDGGDKVVIGGFPSHPTRENLGLCILIKEFLDKLKNGKRKFTSKLRQILNNVRAGVVKNL